LNQIQSDFDTFLATFQNHGAEFVFHFKKFQCNESDFHEIVDFQYKTGLKVLDAIERFKNVDDVARNWPTDSRGNYEHPLNMSVYLAFTQTAKKFGKVLGLEKVEDVKPSTEHAKIANDNNAMAMMGTDTYYIFYEGDWKFWSDADLDMKRMTVREYNKELILTHMGLTIVKAPLFVALAGGLYSSQENIKKIAKNFKPWTKQLLKNVSEFVNRQRFPITDSTLNDIVTKIFGRPDAAIIADFRRTMKLMDPDTVMKISSKFHEKFMEVTRNDFINYGNLILMNTPIHLSPTYMDLR
jgi:hypothetical protein